MRLFAVAKACWRAASSVFVVAFAQVSEPKVAWVLICQVPELFLAIERVPFVLWMILHVA